jgi:SpoIIAA-like
MIELLQGLPDGVVGVEAVGEVTAHDYETVLIPAFDAARAGHDKVNVVFVVGERFTGFAAGALWDDTKYGFSHVKGWGRVALVTDIDWMRHLTHAFSWLSPSGMKVFPVAELDAAKAWVAG